MFGKQVTLGLCLITSAEIAHKGNRTDTGHLRAAKRILLSMIPDRNRGDVDSNSIAQHLQAV